MEHKLGVAVVGAGLMGQAHAKALAASRNGRLVAVTANDQTAARELARACSTDFEPDVASMLARRDVEAVIVATPTDTHCDVASQVIDAGRHVFVEKPIARTLDEAHQLAERAARQGISLAVGHVARYFPEYRRIGDTVAGGTLGTPAVATFGRRCQHPDWAPDAWHTAAARSGGVVLDMMIHDIDLVRWYFGEPSRVYCRTLGPDRNGGLDFALATLTIPDGPICHLHGSWAEPAGFSQSAEICGSEGMIQYDTRETIEFDLQRHAAANSVTALPPRPPSAEDPFTRQVDDWLGHAAGAGTIINDAIWACASLRIALALLESNDQRDVVDLSLDQSEPPRPQNSRPRTEQVMPA